MDLMELSRGEGRRQGRLIAESLVLWFAVHINVAHSGNKPCHSATSCIFGRGQVDLLISNLFTFPGFAPLAKSPVRAAI